MKWDLAPGSLPPLWMLWGPSLLVLLPGGILAATSGFSGLYGQDAYAYFGYATGPLRESLLTLEPLPPFSWPPGYPFILALLSLVMGPVPLAGQLLSWIAAGLVPVFTALIATELGASRNVGLVTILAGGFVALNGQLWQSSIVVMSDTTALAASTLGVWALVRYGNRLQARWLVLAAGALAFAVITRLAYWLVAIPAGTYALSLLLRQPYKQALRQVLPAVALATMILLPVFWPMITSIFVPQRDFVVFARAGEVYTWSPLTALRRVHVTADGVLSYRLPNAIYYAAAPARAFYFSPLIAAFIAPGLWAVLRHRARAPEIRSGRGPWLLLVGWAGSVYLFHAGTAWQNFRFTLAYLPPLAILAALGVVEMIAFLKKRFAGRTWVTYLATLWLLAGLAWATVGGIRLSRDFIRTMQANVETVQWVEEQAPAQAHLVAFGLALTFQHESDLETHNIFSLTAEDLHTLVTGERPVYLLLDIRSIETQWIGRAPAENFHWLQEGPGLTEIGRRQQYTLFAVNGGVDG